MQWGVRIPLRDGVQLSATVYLPENSGIPAPAILIFTPYIGQTYHDQAMCFAANGYAVVVVDVRGRGNSEGEFQPLINEAKDGFDAVEWVARQTYCNGAVAMGGGSYNGYVQWVTAKEFPPHLATIVPVAAPYLGVDFPIRSNIGSTYWMRWLTLVSGRASQEKIFANLSYWGTKFRRWFESGVPFKELDTQLGNPSAIFQEWVAHPELGAYWDSYNPTSEQYASLSMPILTITGIYDVDQPGALMHYRQHLENCTAAARERHLLIIGPWDHSGTRTPTTEFCGLKVAPASMVDLSKLHLEWYAWTMQGGIRPEFLRDHVAYYVMVAERWRYCASLDAATSHSLPFYLHSSENPTDVFRSGSLNTEPPLCTGPDFYIYDPRDVSLAALESSIDPDNQVDQRMVFAACGRHLVYHSAPFEREVEVTGFFRLSLWLSIDQPDTDFRAAMFDVGIDGTATQLASDTLRARYRDGLHEANLVGTLEPLRYDFHRFTFVSRLIRKSNRLRLVIGPLNSIFHQKNFNSGGVVAEESMADARTVTVKLFHDASHRSVLHVPIGQPEV